MHIRNSNISYNDLQNLKTFQHESSLVNSNANFRNDFVQNNPVGTTIAKIQAATGLTNSKPQKQFFYNTTKTKSVGWL